MSADRIRKVYLQRFNPYADGPETTKKFQNGTMLFLFDDHKKKGADTLLEEGFLLEIAKKGFEPIAIDFPGYGNAPFFGEDNSGEINKPAVFVENLMNRLNIEALSNTVVVFSGEIGYFILPFIKAYPRFFKGIMGINPLHDPISEKSIDLEITYRVCGLHLST